MPQDENEKGKRKEKRDKKRRGKGPDSFSLFDLIKVIKRREKRFGEKSGVDFKTGEDIKKKN